MDKLVMGWLAAVALVLGGGIGGCAWSDPSHVDNQTQGVAAGVEMVPGLARLGAQTARVAGVVDPGLEVAVEGLADRFELMADDLDKRLDELERLRMEGVPTSQGQYGSAAIGAGVSALLMGPGGFLAGRGKKNGGG